MGDADNCPDSNWTVDFMEFNSEGHPVAGWSWTWRGVAFNARGALEKALEAMIDAMPHNAHHRRAVRIVMDNLPSMEVAQKSAGSTKA